MINLSEEDIDDLQKIENSVYRTILNAPQYAPNSTLRSEIGSSLMKKRIMNGRINFMKSIINGRKKLLANILHRLLLDNDTNWIQKNRKYMDVVKLKATDRERKSKQEIKQIFTNWDNEQWKQEIQSKSTLRIYKSHKDNIEEEHIYIYDNRPSSGIWFRARTNTLQLNDRHSNKETNCLNCEQQSIIENIEHFILDCTTYKGERQPRA